MRWSSTLLSVIVVSLIAAFLILKFGSVFLLHDVFGLRPPTLNTVSDIITFTPFVVLIGWLIYRRFKRK